MNGPDRGEVTRREFEAMRADFARIGEENRELAERVAQLEATPRRSVYTCKTLAAELEKTPRAIRAAIQRGDLEARLSGGEWVITAEAVAAWGTPRTHKLPRRSSRPAVERRPLRDAIAGLGDS